ncbi:MAG: energy-coupling factor transporter transmembrane component T [Allosphingosinicella sp.]
MSVRPAAAGAATIVSLVSLFLLQPGFGREIFTAGITLILLAAWGGGRARLALRLIGWTLPFVLPLLALHGILNSQFPITGWWLDTVPIRASGVAFGYDLSLRILLFSVVAGFWFAVDRDALVEGLLRLRLPTRFIMVAVQGFVMGRLIQRRIDNVYLAQRARGIPVSGSLGLRLMSLPSLLVPVVVGTFVEADARVPVLLAHGYGRLEPAARPARLELPTVMVIVALLSCLGIALSADWPR